MKPINSLYRLVVLVSVVAIVAPSMSLALPSYARQDSGACFSCHSETPLDIKAFATIYESFNTTDSSLYSDPTTNIKAGVKVHTKGMLNNGQPNGTKQEVDEDGETITSESSNISINGSKVSGFTGYLGTDYFVASFGLLRPDLSLNPIFSRYLFADETQSPSLWYRFALTPKLGEVGLSFGVFGLSGNAPNNLLLGSTKINVYGLDAKVQGNIGDFTLGFETVYMKNNSKEINGNYSPNILDNGAFSAEAQVGLGNSFGLSAAYRTYRSTESSLLNSRSFGMEQAASISAWVNLADRIILQPQYTTFGGDQKIINQNGEFRLRLFTGF